VEVIESWRFNNTVRAFNHVNYEDPDINVAIPVFSIHGNHDDPSGVRPHDKCDRSPRLTLARKAI